MRGGSAPVLGVILYGLGFSQHAGSLYRMRSRIRSLAGSVEMCERNIANVREDLRIRTSTRGDNFSMTLQKETTKGDVTPAGEKFCEILRKISDGVTGTKPRPAKSF